MWASEPGKNSLIAGLPRTLSPFQPIRDKNVCSKTWLWNTLLISSIRQQPEILKRGHCKNMRRCTALECNKVEIQWPEGWKWRKRAVHVPHFLSPWGPVCSAFSRKTSRLSHLSICPGSALNMSACDCVLTPDSFTVQCHPLDCEGGGLIERTFFSLWPRCDFSFQM